MNGCGFSCLIFSFLSFPMVTYALSSEKFQPIGFSKEGRYFAYEVHGVDDVEGDGYYSKYCFVDVQHDRFVKKPVKVVGKDRKTAHKQAEIRNRKQIKKLGIIPGNLGFHDIATSTFDMKKYSKKAVHFSLTEENGAAAQQEIVLTLQALPTKKKKKKCKMVRILMQELMGVKGGWPSVKKSGNKIIYSEKSLPSSRGCPLDYYFMDVFHYLIVKSKKDSFTAAVIVLQYKQGKIEPDYRHLVIAIPKTPYFIESRLSGS